MDNRTFISRLSKAVDMESKATAELVRTLNAIIGEAAAEQDSTAIPGFGTFEAVKTPDHIVTDPVTGEKKLVPPSITIKFKPGSRLKKAVSKKV